MPAMFALGDRVIGNPLVATFAAFGCFALLVLVDFAGTMRERLEAEVTLAVAGALLVCLGTLVSNSTALAAITMAVVGFAVIFSGVVSSVLAGATTSLLLGFILPVSLPGPVSSIPDRLAGWGLASGASLIAITLLWPAPVRNPLRSAAIDACRGLAARLRSADAAAVAHANEAVERLHGMFFATPYRPTGLSTAARTLVRLVDELRWLNDIVVLAPPRMPHDPRVHAVKSAAALVLERGADLLDGAGRSPAELRDSQALLARELDELERTTALELPDSDGEPPLNEAVSALDPSFRAQELSFIVAQVGRNIDFGAAAERRGLARR